MIFFSFFYTQIIPPSQLVRVGFDHPDKREEISLGLSPNWHPWWFFSKLKMWQCSTIHLNWLLKSKHIQTFFFLRYNSLLEMEKTHRCQKFQFLWFDYFLWLCAINYWLFPWLHDFMMVNHAAALPWIFFFFFQCEILDSPAFFTEMKSLIRTDHFGYIVEGFYVIVLQLWRHYKQIQALKGNTLTATEMQRFAHLSLFFFFHTHGLRERDLTAHCLVMRSNQLTGSSCENGETLLSFEF